MLLKSKDIAEMLNISPATVSLALNNKPGVSNETKNKIYAILEEYYASGKFSGGAENDSKGTIILVIHKAETQLFIPTIFFQDVIDNIQSMMIHTGYQLEIIYFNSGMDEKILLDPLNREDVVGVLLYATEMPYSDLPIYANLGKPIVVLDARFPVPNMDMVTLSNHISVVNAVEYAYRMGHRRIGFLKSKIRINNFDDRYSGYLDGLRLVGLDFRPEFVFDVASSTDNACSDFLKILETPIEQLPTIFLTDLDYTVVGALLAIKMKGYSVPDDFSLIGFDDISFMRELDPPVTSIQIKPYFGAIAVSRLIEKIEKEDAYFLNIEVATELVVRKSVKKITNPDEQ